MSKQNYITASCAIRSGKVIINGSLDMTDIGSGTAVDFLKNLYKHYQINYPKFYKMDSLCKLAFIASELLLKKNPVQQKYDAGDIAIILSNSVSSLEIDTEHQLSISDKNNYFPSPAVFVYTLSNIMIGEIAIKNCIKGENTFFIFDKFDAHFMSSYVSSLLKNGKAKCCISGWVDYYENEYEAFLYIVESSEEISGKILSSEQLKELYCKTL